MARLNNNFTFDLQNETYGTFKNFSKIVEDTNDALQVLENAISDLDPSGEVLQHSETLIANQTNPIIIGDITVHRSIHLRYTVVKGSGIQEGIIRVLSYGGEVAIVNDSQFLGEDPNISFSSHINGNDIILNASLGIGQNATFNYQKLIIRI